MKMKDLKSLPGVRKTTLNEVYAEYRESDDQKDATVVRICKLADRMPTTVAMFLQVFHTNIKNLSSSQHLSPVDHDDRRPILFASFDDVTKSMQWLEKNHRWILAGEITNIIQGDSSAVLEQTCFAQDQETLQLFGAWLAHVTGRKRPKWCNALVVEHGEGVASVESPGTLTVEDFNDVLADKKRIEDCIYRKPAADDRAAETLTERPSRDQILERARRQYAQEVLNDAPNQRH